MKAVTKDEDEDVVVFSNPKDTHGRAVYMGD